MDSGGFGHFSTVEAPNGRWPDLYPLADVILEICGCGGVVGGGSQRVQRTGTLHGPTAGTASRFQCVTSRWSIRTAHNDGLSRNGICIAACPGVFTGGTPFS